MANRWTTDWDSTSATSYTISSTTAPEGQQYYSIGPNGEAVPTPMEHNHALPNHTHGNWVQWREPPNIISLGGKEIMRFNDDLQVKIKGEWVSLEEMMKRMDKLESIVENLYNMLPQWKIDMMDIDEDEEINDEIEHIDPDLFKV